MAEYYGGVSSTGLDKSSTVVVGPFKSTNASDRKVNVGVTLGVYNPPRSVSRSWSVSSRTPDVTYSSSVSINHSGRVLGRTYSETSVDYALYFPKYQKGKVSYADVKGTINGHTALVRFITQYETRVNSNRVDVDGNAHNVNIGLVDTAEEDIKSSGVPSWITVDGGTLRIAENTSSSARSANLTFEGSSKVTVSVLQGKAVGISASPSSIKGAQRGGTAKVDIEITGSGVTVASAQSDSDWVTVDTSGNITYDRNPDKTSRTAILTFTGSPEGTDTVTLTQAGSKEVQVYCNRTGSISASVNETWLSVGSDGMSITASNSGTGKTGTMTFQGERGGSATLTIKNQIP